MHVRTNGNERGLMLFSVHKSSIVIGWDVVWGASSPDYRNKLLFVLTNTPFLLPVPIIDDATASLPHQNYVFSWLLTSFSVGCKSAGSVIGHV